MNSKIEEYQEFQRYHDYEDSLYSNEWVNYFPKSNKNKFAELKKLPPPTKQIPQNFKVRFEDAVKRRFIASLVALYDRFA